MDEISTDHVQHKV